LVLFDLCSFAFQTAATKEIFGAASNGKEELVKKCVAKGANVDGHKDLVNYGFSCFGFYF